MELWKMPIIAVICREEVNKKCPIKRLREFGFIEDIKKKLYTGKNDTKKTNIRLFLKNK